MAPESPKKSPMANYQSKEEIEQDLKNFENSLSNIDPINPLIGVLQNEELSDPVFNHFKKS